MIALPWKIIAMLLIACCACAGAAATVEPLLLPVLEESHSQLLLRTKEATRNNLKRPFKSFQKNARKMHSLSKELDDAESKSLDKDKFTRSLLPAQIAPQYMNSRIAVFCNTFSGCTSPKKSLDFFRCFKSARRLGLRRAPSCKEISTPAPAVPAHVTVTIRPTLRLSSTS